VRGTPGTLQTHALPRAGEGRIHPRHPVCEAEALPTNSLSPAHAASTEFVGSPYRRGVAGKFPSIPTGN